MHEKVIKQVNEIISPAYLVGGAVRDVVRGFEPEDFDFATPMLPSDIEAAIVGAGRHCYDVGKAFGTLEFKLDGIKVQVTTFRTEKYRAGSRHPEVAYVADLHADLSRRDFTINAMAIDPDGGIIDPFMGRVDALEMRLKGVGNARERFKEDPLRMLRLARFAAQLGYGVDEDTANAAIRLAPRIATVSRNRWMPELDKLLMGNWADAGLHYLAELGLLKYVLPEIWLQVDYDQQSPYHSKTLWEHTRSAVSAAPKVLDLRWAALLHDVGKPFVARRRSKTFLRGEEEVEQVSYVDHDIVGTEIASGIAARLHWSKARLVTVLNLIANHLADDSPLKAYDKGAQ